VAGRTGTGGRSGWSRHPSVDAVLESEEEPWEERSGVAGQCNVAPKPWSQRGRERPWTNDDGLFGHQCLNRLRPK
jgi:hypothetical protein